MPIERRIREGAERNAGVLDPDVDRFLDSVVHKTHRRQVIRRSLTAAASVAAVALAVVLGPKSLTAWATDGRDGARIRSHADRHAGRSPGDRHVHAVDPGGDGSGAGRRHRGHLVDQRRRGRACAAGGPCVVRRRPKVPPVEMQADTLQTVAFDSDICEGLPAGTYGWTLSGDFLLLSAFSDPCDARVFILGARPWSLAS